MSNSADQDVASGNPQINPEDFRDAPYFSYGNPEHYPEGPKLTEEQARLERAEVLKSEQLRNLQNLDDVHAVCRRFARALHCDYVLFGYHLPSLGAHQRFVMSCYPLAWTERYNKMRYSQVDPVLKRVFASGEPFEWKDLATETPEQRAMMNDAYLHGLRSGFTCRATSAYGAHGMISFCSSEANWELGDKQELYLGAAMRFCGAVTDSITNLLKKIGKLKSVETLTDQQRKVLILASQGLLNKQIADRLNIAPATVDYHVRNAMHVLEVKTRTEAVSLSIETGMALTAPGPVMIARDQIQTFESLIGKKDAARRTPA